jgi:hypothetical protein
LKRLSRAADEELIAIPQQDGSVKKFGEDAVMDAYLSWYKRGFARHHDEPIPEEHPLLPALRNAHEAAMPALVGKHGTVISLMRSEP